MPTHDKPTRGARAVTWTTGAVALLALAAGGVLLARGCIAAPPDVRGVSDVSVAYGTLTVVQDGTDRLEIKADPGVAPLVMARRTGALLELGLLDDADVRVLLIPWMPKWDPSAELEFVLHTTTANRFAANDHGNVRIDGFRADELRIATMSVATVVAKNIDVDVLDVSFDGDSTGSVVVSGHAGSKTVFQSGAPATFDDSGLTVGGS